MYVRALEDGHDVRSFALALSGADRVWLDGDGRSEVGGWSFLGCEPREIREARFGTPAPLSMLDRLGDAEIESHVDEVPVHAIPRWVGFIAYDAALSDPSALEWRFKAQRPRTSSIPVLRFARYDALIAIDHHRDRAFLVGDDRVACERLWGRLDRRDRIQARMRSPVASSEADHLRAVQRALDAMRAGELYQVNLARAWRTSISGDPLALFLAMRDASPVPLGAFIEFGASAVLSRSMETFLRFDSDARTIETRPIKGTIARGGSLEKEAAQLRADPKEHAEHSMVVDLMRNDLGRIAEPGSVSVTERMQVEPYAGLSHLVSTVRARVPRETSKAAILRATFPPGSVTGTPKRRAMEWIEALESAPRGVYCGAIGHFDRAGGFHFSVAIRTAVLEAGELTYWAGGGIVEASIPDREVAETELKARVFLEACHALGHSD